MTIQIFDVADESSLPRLEEILLSSETPLHERFRALFLLKKVGTKDAIDIIGKCFCDISDLLKHELAYVLGQMKNPHALDILQNVLSNVNFHPMVRHEAAEAIGAIGEEKSIELLEKFIDDKEIVVRETVELAINKIQYEKEKGKNGSRSLIYNTIDPAPPFDSDSLNLEELEYIFLHDKSLFQRYRAMFTLRNIGGDRAVEILSKGLYEDKTSALFRHEVAYVFGQMQDQNSIPALQKVLSSNIECAMVRHECAEALGSIADKDCLPSLHKNLGDEERIVAESCQVALDIYNIENNFIASPF
jgi:deoxyhypusine monooxygenase